MFFPLFILLLLGTPNVLAFTPVNSIKHSIKSCSYRNIQKSQKITITSPSFNFDSSSNPLRATPSSPPPPLIGDDAAAFSLSEQSASKWGQFTAATTAVLLATSFVWFLPYGPHWGNEFLAFCQHAIHSTRPDLTVLSMLSVFAIAHSGLAGLRPYSEALIGARAHRVIFAVVSLPLALSCISYFVNHCHEGAHLWDISTNASPALHTVFWITNFVSFIFLYPSTFNLLEIAAIEKPQLHLWETGITRITRHPQAVGQVLWCAAHTMWLGTSTALAASTGEWSEEGLFISHSYPLTQFQFQFPVLIGHHAYSVWHGDRRLQQKHGEKFDLIKERTSVVPFAAILDGRQVLPSDYYKEFLRGPYLLIVGGTTLAYLAHPWFLAGASLAGW